MHRFLKTHSQIFSVIFIASLLIISANSFAAPVNPNSANASKTLWSRFLGIIGSEKKAPGKYSSGTAGERTELQTAEDAADSGRSSKGAENKAGSGENHGIEKSGAIRKVKSIVIKEDTIAKLDPPNFFTDYSVLVHNEPPFELVGGEGTIENIAAFLTSQIDDVLMLTGPRGAGKTHSLKSVQQAMIAGRVPNAQNTRLIEVNASSDEFLNVASFNSHLLALKRHLETLGPIVPNSNDPQRVILVFNDMSAFAGKANETAFKNLSAYIDLAKTHFGKNTAIIGKSVPGTTKVITERLDGTLTTYRVIQITEMPKGPESLRALRNSFDGELLPKYGVNASDEILSLADQWGRQFFPDQAAPGSGRRLLIEALSRKKTSLALGYSNLTKPLKADKDTLLAEKMHFEVLRETLKKEGRPLGHFGRKRLNEIPAEIAEIDSKILEVEKIQIIISKRARLVEQIEELKTAIPILEGQLTLQPDKIAILTQKKAALQNLEKALTKMEKEIGYDQLATNLTKEDLAIAVHHLKEADYIELLTNKRLLSEDEVVQKMSEAIIDQAHMTPIYRAIYRAQNGARLVDKPDAPEYSIMLLGPPGVGKTERMRKLAEFLNKKLEKLDMGEYQGETAAKRVTGSDPGYVGYEQGSIIVNALRRFGRTLLLLDEPEKAHRSVFDVFMNLIDHGVLTDGRGMSGSARESVVAMASNLLQDEIIAGKITSETAEAVVRESLKQTGVFRPEFIDRFTKIVVIDNLKDEERILILMQKLKNVEKAYAKKHYGVELSDDVKASIFTEYFTSGSGKSVREIERLVSEKLMTEIQGVIQNQGYTYKGIRKTLKVREGDTIVVKADVEGKLYFRVRSP